jgi:amino-acid N-acetyltransferase
MTTAEPNGASTGFTVRPARPADLTAVVSLLDAASLPSAGVAEWFEAFVVAESGGVVIGAAGLELYDSGALLRSVVVAPGWKGQGVGSVLVEAALALAARHSLTLVFLLTTTADRYFPRHGFAKITRADVPADVKTSIEFRELCAETAIVMVRDGAGRERAAAHG